LDVKSNCIGIVLALVTCFTTVASGADQECPALAKAVSLCTVLADSSKYDGKEITVTGLYRMVIHGSILMSPECGNTYVNVRRAPDYRVEKHVLTVVRFLTKHDRFQPVDVVIRGTLHVAANGQCFRPKLLALRD
jgi:hypothetical protein